MTSLDADEAATNKQMSARCSSLVVLADSSKFDRRCTYAVTKLERGDLLISNTEITGPLSHNLKDTGAIVLLAQEVAHA